MSLGRPNFLIIGAMKCATSSLHDQLALQPGIFMSTPKEPNFFSDDDNYARGLPYYESLFDQAPTGALCGESSTHYTKLPTHPHTVSRLREALPEAKLIYVMREPLARLVSHYIHEWTQKVMHGSIDSAVERWPELVHYGCYAMQLRPYLATYGADRILPVFFEHLVEDPQSELERICRFIGYRGKVEWHAHLIPSNISKERLRVSPWRDRLAYAPGISQLRKYLVPRFVREFIKSFWRMQDRPELSADVKTKVMRRFDDDLQILSEWLGITLSSGPAFGPVAKSSMPTWTAPARALYGVSLKQR